MKFISGRRNLAACALTVLFAVSSMAEYFTEDVDMSIFVSGENGYKIMGSESAQSIGSAVSNAGDVNHDGYFDFLISSYSASPSGRSNAGEVFILYGNATGRYEGDRDLANLNDGFYGVKIIGAADNDNCGRSVAAAGDLNGDSFEDVIIGCPNAAFDGRSNSGVVHVIFGAASLPILIDLQASLSGLGFSLYGETAGDNLGFSVSFGGFTTAGSNPFLLLGAPNFQSSRGRVYLVRGVNGDPVDYVNADLSDTQSTPYEIHMITGHQDSMSLGYCVAGLFDVNLDTHDDFAIGAPMYSPDGSLSNSGIVYVFFGSTDGLYTLTTDSFSSSEVRGFAIQGAASGDSAGIMVIDAGDVNGDGFGDLILSAYGAGSSENPASGAAYVVFGTSESEGAIADLDLAVLNDGSPSQRAFRILGSAAGDHGLLSAAGPGDVNNDAIDDIIIGVSLGDKGTEQSDLQVGAAYIIYGSTDSIRSEVNLATFETGANGVIIYGADSGDALGSCVAYADDVNGDGISDYLVSAPGATHNGVSQSGSVYLLYGGVGKNFQPPTSMPTHSVVSGPTISTEGREPTPEPTAEPTTEPTAEPTTEPTAEPTTEPTAEPTTEPTAEPTTEPTAPPTFEPSADPTASPTYSDYMLSVFASKTYKIRNLYAFATMHPEDRTPRAWGSTKLGGMANFTAPLSRIIPSTSAFLGVTTTGGLVAWGMNSSIAGWQAHSNANIVADSVVATGGAFAGITTAGAVVTVGSAAVGGNVASEFWSNGFTSQLTGSVKAIYATAASFAALKEDGTVYVWGSKFASGGFTTKDTAVSGIVKIAATTTSIACIDANGAVTVVGDALSGGDISAVQDRLTSGVVHIVGSKSAFAAFKEDTSLVTWGHPTRGGDSSAVASSLSSGVMRVIFNDLAFAALKTDGSVVTWGESAYGGDSSSVQALLVDVVSLYSTGKAFAALTSAGRVVTWGASSHGGSIPSQHTDALSSDVVGVYSTRRAFAARKSSGAVIVWGNAYQGGAAYEVAQYLTSDVVMVCANEAAFTAFRGDGKVVMWGHMTVLGTTGGRVVATDASAASIAGCA